MGDGGNSGSSWVTVDEDGNVIGHKTESSRNRGAAGRDLSPPRRPAVRARRDADGDLSPPRRGPAVAAEPAAKKRHDSDDDQSPPRRAGGPPPQAAKKRHDSDDDQSPPRRAGGPPPQAAKKRHDSDDDQSPPRRAGGPPPPAVKKRHDSDDDQSPPRRSDAPAAGGKPPPPGQRTVSGLRPGSVHAGPRTCARAPLLLPRALARALSSPEACSSGLSARAFRVASQVLDSAER